MADDFIWIADAARNLQITEKDVLRLIAAGRLEAWALSVVGREWLRVAPASIEQALKLGHGQFKVKLILEERDDALIVAEPVAPITIDGLRVKRAECDAMRDLQSGKGTSEGAPSSNQEGEDFWHAEDFSTVWWQGVTVQLTSDTQRKIIRYLHEQHRKGIADVKHQDVMDAVKAKKERLSDEFRDENGRKAWALLIGRRSHGRYYLKPFERR